MGLCTDTSNNQFSSFTSDVTFSRGSCDLACSDTVGCIGYQVYEPGYVDKGDDQTKDCILLGPTFDARSPPTAGRQAWTFWQGTGVGDIAGVYKNAYDYKCYKKTTPPKGTLATLPVSFRFERSCCALVLLM